MSLSSNWWFEAIKCVMVVNFGGSRSASLLSAPAGSTGLSVVGHLILGCAAVVMGVPSRSILDLRKWRIL